MDTQALYISKPPLIYVRGFGDISAVRNKLMNMIGSEIFFSHPRIVV